LDEKLQGVDLQADMEAVLAEDHVLAAALQAAAGAEAAEAAGTAAAAAAAATSGMSREQQARADAARARQEVGGIALLDEDMEDEAEALPGVASFLLINSKRGGIEAVSACAALCPRPLLRWFPVAGWAAVCRAPCVCGAWAACRLM
jgi:hypothetical protein